MALFAIIALVFTVGASGSGTKGGSTPDTLLWSDEFDGSELDNEKWNVEIGTGSQYMPAMNGWGNNEAQYYREENVFIQDGKLIIEAKKENFIRSYTSGKINTAGIKLPDGTVKPEKYFVRMGKVEARIKAPRGRGLWPCFWLLGSDYTKYSNKNLQIQDDPAWAKNKNLPLGWPRCGEIDIFEMNGRLDARYGATLHYGEWWPKNKFKTKNKIHTKSLANDWHDYGVIWDSHSVKYTFDGAVWAVVDLKSLGTGSYVYGNSFTNPHGYSIILCLAIGGNYLNNQLPLDSTWTSSPPEDRRLEVDWVRVYGK